MDSVSHLTNRDLIILQIEVATGKFPYPKWKSVFDQLTQVVKGDPPRLTNEDGRNFSDEMLSFTNMW